MNDVIIEGFTRLEYIETTGTQYLVTDYTAPNGFHVIFDIAPTKFGSGQQMLVGNHRDAQPYERNYISFQNDTFDMGVGRGLIHIPDKNVYNRYILEASTEYNNVYAKLNDKNLTLNIAESLTSDYPTNPIWIFHVNSQWSSPIYAKIYHVYLDIIGVAKLDLYPVRRRSDRVVGFYDIINKKFYTNSGTGEFTIGPTISFLEDDRIVSTKNVYNVYQNHFVNQQLEYIESDGNQYIDTHWKPTNNTKIEFDIQADTTLGECQIVGSRTNTGSSDRFLLLITAGKQYRFDFGSKQLNLSTSAPRSGKIHIIMNKNRITVGYVSGTATFSAFRSTHSIYICAVNTNETTSKNLAAKVLSCKIYNNNKLVRDYIPMRYYTGEVGMYDLIHNQFYGNSGTGSFTAGPVVKNLNDTKLVAPTYEKPASIYYVGKLLGLELANLETKNRLASARNFKQCIDHASNSGLPKGYYPIEYLQSTGTQYINSGYNPGGNTRVVTRLEVVEEIGLESMTFFGSRQTSAGSKVYAVWGETTNRRLRWDYNTSVYSLDTIPYLNEWEIDFNMNTFDANELHKTATKATYTVTRPMYIFALNQGTFNSNQIARMKLYYMKIYDSGEIIRDFVPCIRETDSKPGLYDRINGVFYTNVGSGEFLVGNRIRIFEANMQ